MVSTIDRQQRLTELYEEYHPPDQELHEVLLEPERYALIEQYPISRHHYISTHATPEDAGRYFTHQEDDGWTIVFLEDLDHGERYDGHLSVEWWLR